MDIRMTTDHDQRAWDDYVLNHADGLAYHQYAWKIAIAEAYHFDACYLIAEENKEICGVLPLIEFKLPFFTRSYISLPYCDVGGPLVDRPDIETALLAEAKRVAVGNGIESIELRQKGKRTESAHQDKSPYKVRMVLDLPDSSELLFSNMKSKLRSQVRKPMRDGLTTRLGGTELITAFYQVFSENMRDIGSPVHSRKWLESVVHHYAENVKVGVAFTSDGQPIAGGIILLHGKTVSCPWASSLRKFNKLNPNMLLYWTFLAFAADHGFNMFDFGRSTPGEGTFRFKEQWGARAENLAWRQDGLTGGTSQIFSGTSGIRPVMERVWTRMPLTLCNALGPILRRHISL